VSVFQQVLPPPAAPTRGSVADRWCGAQVRAVRELSGGEGGDVGAGAFPADAIDAEEAVVRNTFGGSVGGGDEADDGPVQPGVHDQFAHAEQFAVPLTEFADQADLAADRALTEPADAFGDYLTLLLARQGTDPAFAEVLTTPMTESPQLPSVRRCIECSRGRRRALDGALFEPRVGEGMMFVHNDPAPVLLAQPEGEA
jgi:hypothetical protein